VHLVGAFPVAMSASFDGLRRSIRQTELSGIGTLRDALPVSGLCGSRPGCTEKITSALLLGWMGETKFYFIGASRLGAAFLILSSTVHSGQVQLFCSPPGCGIHHLSSGATNVLVSDRG
jgi:hypothetical protein